MFEELLAGLVAAPIRIINVPVKATKAVLDASMGDPVELEDNVLDEIADVVADAVKDIFE